MNNIPEVCAQHGSKITKFCDIDHASKISTEEYNNLTNDEYDKLHEDGREYELNFDEGFKCTNGCVFSFSVKIKQEVKK